MKNIVLAIMGVFALSMMVAPIAVQASDSHDDEMKHYEATEFTKKKDAMKGLIETSQQMAALAADENLDVGKMEQIHQISYTTENAVGFLNKKNKLDGLAAKLEVLHLASEDHSAADLRRAFIMYQSALNDYLVDSHCH